MRFSSRTSRLVARFIARAARSSWSSNREPTRARNLSHVIKPSRTRGSESHAASAGFCSNLAIRVLRSVIDFTGVIEERLAVKRSR